MPTRSSPASSAARTSSRMRSSLSVAGTSEIPNWMGVSAPPAAICTNLLPSLWEELLPSIPLDHVSQAILRVVAHKQAKTASRWPAPSRSIRLGRGRSTLGRMSSPLAPGEAPAPPLRGELRYALEFARLLADRDFRSPPPA